MPTWLKRLCPRTRDFTEAKAKIPWNPEIEYWYCDHWAMERAGIRTNTMRVGTGPPGETYFRVEAIPKELAYKEYISRRREMEPCCEKSQPCKHLNGLIIGGPVLVCTQQLQQCSVETKDN